MEDHGRLKSPGTPRAIGDLLTDAVPQLSDRLAELRLQQSWEAVVGSDIARRTRPGNLAEGCLTVIVDNSPWLQELSLRRAELLARIQRRCAAVRVLRLTVGSLVTNQASAVTPDPRPVTVLSDGDRREIEEATATISDAALAKAAQRLLARARLAVGTPGPGQ
jgi:hypothetical protein